MKKLALVALLFLWSPFLFAQGGAKTSGGGAVTGTSGAVNITAGGTNQNITLTPSGSGASVVANFQDKGGQVFNVKAYGAKGDGTTDDLASVNSTYSAASQYSTVYFPAGTYALSGALDLVAGVNTQCSPNTVLLFTGATNGVVWPANTAGMQLDGCTIETSNASGGKALDMDSSSSGIITQAVIRNVTIAYNSTGRWAYGVWGSAWETSYVYSLKIEDAATVGIHLENATNAISFFGLEIHGTSGSGTIQRGIEETGCDDNEYYGGTIQAYFTKSLINLANDTAQFYGFHLEDTNSSPSDGADVIIDGPSLYSDGPSFIGIQGGSFLIGVSNDVHYWSVLNSNISSLTLSVHAFNGLVAGTQISTLTDNSYSNGYNTILSPEYGQPIQIGEGPLKIQASNSSVTGTTAGSAKSFLGLTGYPNGGLGVLTLYFNGYENTTATAQTITFNRAWNYDPALVGNCPSGLTVSAGGTTSTVTLPTSMGAAFTGQCIAIGQ